MNLLSKKDIKELLEKNKIKLSKGLGQNFLIDEIILKKFIKTIDIQSNDTILEVGSGIGTITQELCKKAKQVVAVEKDQKISEILKDNLKDFKNLEIINNDILKLNLSSTKFQVQSSKIVGNLPFYITSPVIRNFLELQIPPKELIFIIQKEVAQRICAKPPKSNILAISIQFFSKPEIISRIPSNSFYPRPKVESSIIKLTPIDNYKSLIEKKLFFKIIKAGFSQPRKQLINNLSKNLQIDKEKIEKILLKNNINPKQRAETLTIEDWIGLSHSLETN
ncbi:MAG: 16S rRNA (adenine(1518)-N(6)/adenine(1519)-N(6))-dimethyltransferase RsmA [Candidatus Nealsonbacteria bacterium]